ncbi:YHS domain-containing (seleno)protein [Lacibacter sp. MH-610]|uniref:YHS domain-containing (seleno)protein n=1 Tax=Lacibacter sp. MH-610 TaxID=3020883 RepID=UPI003891C403
MKQLFVISLLLVSGFAFAQDQQRVQQFNLEKGVAVKGYDPVAYFTQNKAVKGKAQFAVIHLGVKYYFSSNDNKEEFKKNPAKYEPQYGGWCAYAMGETGEKVDFDPETFKILNGKLYLFYNKFFNNTLPKWNKDEANLKTKADVNWKKFYHL